ncbi:MAG: AI-2E family transporter [Parcubacteria group bacterium]
MKENYNKYFFLAVLFGLTVLAFFMMQSFLIPFLFALILVHFFAPAYDFVLKKTGQKGLSSAVACSLIALIIIIPAVIFLTLAANEVQAAIARLAGNTDIFERIASLSARLSEIPFFKAIDFEGLTDQNSILSVSKNFSQGFLFILQGAYTGILRFAFVMFIMFFSLFYMFIDGEKLLARVMNFIPLKNEYKGELLERLNSMVRATIKGTILMAILQGILSGILFWATGVSSPLLFGSLVAISSVIPSLGSGLVWLPVGVAMIVLGHPTSGIAILLVGLLVISTIDNLLRPKLVGNDTQMHPLLILFSTLGGITFFGISGFIIGPVIVSLLVSLWDIYALEAEA